MTPLTPEHKRFLRFKSYSFPFLCEPRFSAVNDEDEIDAVIRDLNEEDGANNATFKWIDVDDDETLNQDDDGDEDAKFFTFGKTGLGSSGDHREGLGWTDFLRAQETSIGTDEVL